MTRALPLVSALLCSCIIVAPLPPEEQWGDAPPPSSEAPASDTPAPAPLGAPTPPQPSPRPSPDVSVLSCEEVELEERYLDRACEGFPAMPVEAVAGLEAVPEPLRQCLLTAIPMPPQGATPSDCQQSAAHRLMSRLNRMGWLDARVKPVRIPGAGAWGGPPWLHVEPGGRYQIGELHMAYFSGIELKREDIFVEARKAIPESTPWALDSTREAMRQRLLQMGVFAEVSVTPMNRDSTSLRLPLEITGKLIPSLSARAKGCPEREGFCLMGRYQCKIDPRTGCATKNCQCVGNSPLGWQ